MSVDAFAQAGAIEKAVASTNRIENAIAVGTLRDNAAAVKAQGGPTFLQALLGAAADFLEGLPVALPVSLSKDDTFSAKNPFGVQYSFSVTGSASAQLNGTPS